MPAEGGTMPGAGGFDGWSTGAAGGMGAVGAGGAPPAAGVTLGAGKSGVRVGSVPGESPMGGTALGTLVGEAVGAGTEVSEATFTMVHPPALTGALHGPVEV